MSAPAPKVVQFKAAALAYASRFGWSVFPVHSVVSGVCTCGDKQCKRPGKHPVSKLAPHGLKDATKDQEIIKRWWTANPSVNIGVATGAASGFFALDVDIGKGGEDSLFDLRQKCNSWPDTVSQITGSGGWHFLFTHPGMTVLNSVEILGPGLDVRGDGGYIVVPPSEHISGRRYEWEGSSRPDEISIKKAPDYLIERVLKRIKDKSDNDIPYNNQELDKNEIERIKSAIYYIDAENRDNWLKVGMALHARCNCKSAYAIWCEWSRQSDKFDPKSQFKTWQSFKPDGGVTLGTLFEMARKNKWSPSSGEQIKEEAEIAVELWKDALYRGGRGGVIPSLANLETILLNSPQWADVLFFDTFSQRIMKRKPPPWDASEPGEWTDTDDVRAAIWLERAFFAQWSLENVRRAVAVAAEKSPIHPVREYLESVEWDGKPRLTMWLITYMGAEDTPYHRLIGRAWMIAAVARVYQPGCQVDTVLILEGAQGIGKSTALNILGSPWYDDTAVDLSSKDIYLAMRGRWIIELGELDSLNRAEVSRAKQFFTVRQDSYRPPYGRSVITVPRQCVFAGTVNQFAYLRDDENRRYWPVLCGSVASERLRRHRAQLWGEAVVQYRAGEPWWIESGLDYVREAQDARQTADPWEDRIREYLMGRPQASMRDLMEEALGLKADRQDRMAEMRISHILKKEGWRRVRVGGRKDRQWAYVSPECVPT